MCFNDSTLSLTGLNPSARTSLPERTPTVTRVFGPSCVVSVSRSACEAEQDRDAGNLVLVAIVFPADLLEKLFAPFQQRT